MESEKNKNSEDSEGPSVESSNQVERIEARRKRIQKRIEAAKR